MRRLFLAFVVVCRLVASAGAVEPVRFGIDVLPILSDNCFYCHGPDEKHREADLRLDDRDSAIEHEAIVPSKSAASELVRRILSTDADEQMPPPSSNRKLTSEQIALLKRWIDEGAVWGKHWAYETPVRPSLPNVKDKAWPKNPIDYFVLARLEREGLKPSPAADKATLLRRVTLDLTGLPPTADELAAFLGDDSDEAYERLVERLLASPRYGERWAWDWLDAARYADSSGYQGDPDRTMWPWRDWVVQAANANMPYDQFTVWQLAGDLLPEATQEQKLATGFNRNHMFNGEGGRIAEETRVENVMDRTETTGTVWLGLTVGCARCHDHKFDPLTNREYYRLYAYFNNTSETGAGRGGAVEPNLDLSSVEDRRAESEIANRMKQLAAEVTRRENELFPPREKKKLPTGPEFEGLPEEVLLALTVEPEKRTSNDLRTLATQFKSKHSDYAKALSQLKGSVEAREKARAKRPLVMVMDDLKESRETLMLAKGAYDKPGEKVMPGVPAALAKLPQDAPNNRLGLAEWIVDRANPLTSRVTVNRYWQAFFGLGLVKTAEDFGVQGQLPSHPELLDWLAVDFIESGWDVKRLHKLIVTGNAYRQSSQVSAKLVERDPDNRLLARGPRFRLPSWMLRDQALALGGLLVEKQGGPPVKPYQPEGIWEEATFGKKSYVQDHGEALYRRSLYVFWRRIVGPTMFFDVSARQVCTVKTIRTNTPLHALTTLNDVTYVEAARAFAERMLKQTEDRDGQIGWAFERATARRPSEAEARTLAATWAKLRTQYADDPAAAAALLKVGESKRDESLDSADHAAATALCLMILNLDEVLTKQ